MEDKITIIEGPPPTFEAVSDTWALGINESPTLGDVAITRLRTFNGPALVERCYRAWHDQQTIHLEFRTSDGLEQRAPIVAARTIETEEGHLLILWVRLANADTELELGYEDDFDEEDFEDDDDEDFDDDDIDDEDLDGEDPLNPTGWSL